MNKVLSVVQNTVFLAKSLFILYQSPQIASDSPVFFAKFR